MTIQVTFAERKLQTSCQPAELLKALNLESSSNVCILESAEVGKNASQSSIVGLNAAVKISGYAEQVELLALNNNGIALINVLAEQYHTEISDNRLVIRLSGLLRQAGQFKDIAAINVVKGLINQFEYENQDEAKDLYFVGCFSYDLIELVEDLPEPQQNEINPLFEYLLLDQLAVIEHQKSITRIIELSFSQQTGNQYVDFSKIEKAINTAQKESANTAQEQVVPKLQYADQCSLTDVEVNISDQAFAEIVKQCQSHIDCGDVFQIVPSRQYSMPCSNPLLAYQTLTEVNPGPYMFYIKFDNKTILGSSPESAVSYDKSSNQVGVMPIAGTRKRKFDQDGNIDHEQDTRAEIDLRLDEKELAEHLMLVDLARNDVAKISQFGTRRVSELMTMTKYARVMHLVSKVVGQLNPDLDALDAYMGTLNMGTLVGAPKIEASKLLRQFEPQKRDLFGGAVGYLRGDGNLDTAIAIRTAVVRDGVAKVQAGAGVVIDSVPELEAKETLAKASAVLLSIFESEIITNKLEQLTVTKSNQQGVQA